MSASVPVRRDIDGLRAVAVVFVLLFHGGVNGFSSGFIGVDVFFVISGFLITGIITGDLRDGRFRLGDFYARRARRILPLLVFVSAVSLTVAAALQLPDSFAPTARSVLAGLLQYANLHFATERGYFDLAVDFEPMIHTWSLSVEWQFYLVMPFVLVLAHRRGKDRLVNLALILCCLASLLVALTNAAHPKPGHFYAFAPRIWEFLAGALIHLIRFDRPERPGPRRIGSACSAIGLALLCLALIAMPPAAPTPGGWTLLPVLAAALIIAGGQAGGPATRVLSTRPLVHLGQISYGLYLWHQPILAFARSLYRDANLPLPLVSLCLAAAALLATATHRWIEQPFRRPDRIGTALFIKATAGLATATALLAWSGGNGWLDPLRFTSDESAIIASARRSNLRDLGCDPAHCDLHGYSPDDVMLVGDSNAYHFSVPLDQALTAANRKVLNLSKAGCPPLTGMTRDDFSADRNAACQTHNQAVLALLQRKDTPHDVILSAAWAIYYDRASIALRPAEAPALGESERRALLLQRLDRQIDLWAASGKRIILVLPLPTPPRDPLMSRVDLHRDGPTFPLSAFTRANADLYAVLRKPRAGAITLYDPAERLCPSGADDRPCRTRIDGKFIFGDQQHVSDFGARFVFGPLFARVTAR